jgi:hypothetical protein
MPSNNLLQTPRQFATKAICIKLESAGYGVDANPSGLVDWIEARNVSLTPMDVDKVDRNIDLPYLGSAGSVIVGMWAKLSFDVALVGSGTAGVKPKWSPLMMGVGFAETVTATTSVEYSLVSRNFSSLTGYINIDGTLHKLLGMRGEMKGKMDAKGTPMLSFAFDSLFLAPVVGAMPTVNRSGWEIEEGVNAANTGPASINGVDLAWSSLEWSLGNKVGRINLPGPQVEVNIGGRSATGSITVLAPPLTEFDPFAMAASGAMYPVTIEHGKTDGKIVQVDMNVKLGAPEYTEVEGIVAYKLPLEIVPNVGNDDIAFTML